MSKKDDPTHTYVSRGGLKLEKAAAVFGLDFIGKTILDVGSSTGGFSDFALQHGANQIIAIDSGTNQLHPKLRGDGRIFLREQTDIRNISELPQPIDIVLIDVSFISLKKVLPVVATLVSPKTQIIALVKPQFEAEIQEKNRGIIKNNKIRRAILKDFENWARDQFTVLNKVDSDVSGSKGNIERFFLLHKH